MERSSSRDLRKLSLPHFQRFAALQVWQSLALAKFKFDRSNGGQVPKRLPNHLPNGPSHAWRNGFFCLFCAWALFIIASLPAAHAQTPAAPAVDTMQRLDQVRTNLDQVRKTLGTPAMPDATLQDLRAKLDPLSQSAQAIVTDLTPRLEEVKTRLAQLGPKPAATAPAENPAITTERDNQQKLFDAIDSELKQARLLAVEIDQTSDVIVDRRRVLFTNALFTRSQSIFAPTLWVDVLSEVPRDARAMVELGRDWGESAAARLAGWRAAGLLAPLFAILLLYLGAGRLARRVLRRAAGPETPTRLRRVIGALWNAAVVTAVPVGVVVALFEVLRAFDLFDTNFDPLLQSILAAVARVALTLGIAVGLFAPSNPRCRLVEINDASAWSLVRLSVAVAAVVSVTRILNALNDLVAASLPVSVALTGLSALLVALFIAATLHSLARAQEQEEENSAKTIAESPWQGPIRLAAWVAVAVIVGAVIVGYTAFAAFLVRQIVWAAFVGSGLYLFVLLANDGIAAALEPRALVGRGIVSSLGMRRDSLGQIATLLSGGTSAALFIAAALLMLAPWGVASTDMFGSLRAAYLGFSVDGITISLASILTTLLIFLVVLGITRAVQRWLELTFLPQTQLDSGLRNSIKTSFGYAGFIVAAATALGYLGLTFSQVAIIAGALSVGIGFGLQSIVNNFVSGLILLWERAIRVGDWVVVGDEQGYVKRINVRSTEIETFDRATMIVPNSNLISGVVKNWVSGDRIGRIRLPLPVNLAADPEQVREILVACAKAHDLVVKIPAPQAIFASMAETGLKFELLCYVGDVETALRVKSDLHFEIFKRFREAGIGIAPAAGPPPTINITGLTRATENPSAEVRSTDAPRRIGTK